MREELSDNILDNKQLPCDIDNVCFAKGKVYGKHNNIPLSDKEVELLKMEFPKPEANIPWEVAIDAVSSYLHRNPKSIDGLGNFSEYVSTWNYDGAVRNFEAKKRSREKDNESKPKKSDQYTQEQLNSFFSDLDEVNI